MDPETVPVEVKRVALSGLRPGCLTDRELLNHVRHSLTNYDALCEQFPDRRRLIATRVLRAIADAYPELKAECDAKLSRLGEDDEAFQFRRAKQAAGVARSVNERSDEFLCYDTESGGLVRETIPNVPRWYFDQEVFLVALRLLESIRDVVSQDRASVWIDGFASERFPWRELAIWELIAAEVQKYDRHHPEHRRAALAACLAASWCLSNATGGRPVVPATPPLYHRCQAIADRMLGAARSEKFRDRCDELEKMIRASQRPPPTAARDEP